MISDSITSFTDPLSYKSEPFEFLFNQHFASNLQFRQFNPFNNGYMTSFLLALLTVAIEKLSYYSIKEIYVGIIGRSEGLRTVTIMNQRSKGKTLTLAQSFYFQDDFFQVEKKGLSKEERAQIEGLSNEEMDLIVIDFVVYDLNANLTSIENCENVVNKIVLPYMERLAEGESSTSAQVKEFRRLKELFELPKELIDESIDLLDQKNIYSLVNHIQSLMTKPICQMFAQSNCDSNIEAHGFIHGILFTILAIYTNIKVNIIGSNAEKANLMLEPNAHLKDMGQSAHPLMINLAGSSVALQPDKSFIKSLLNMVEALLPLDGLSLSKQATDVARYVSEQLQLIVAFDYQHQSPIYVQKYILGMLISALKEGIYLPKEGTTSLVIARPIEKLMIIFNFRKQGSQLDVDLSQFPDYEKIRAAVVITIETNLSSCNPKISRNFISHFDVSVDVKQVDDFIENEYDDYYHLNITQNIVQNVVLLHSKQDKVLKSVFTGLASFISSGSSIYKVDENAFQYLVHGLFHNVEAFIDDITVTKFYSAAAYSIRFESNKRITLINFISFKFIEQYKANLNMGARETRENYRVINILYDYDKTRDIFGIFMKKDHIFYLSSFTYSACYSSSGEMKECSEFLNKNNRHALSIADNPTLPKEYRIYYEAIQESTQPGQSVNSWQDVADNLDDPYFSLDKQSGDDVGLRNSENLLAWRVAKAESKWLKAGKLVLKVVGKLLPIVVIALDQKQLFSSVRTLVNGDINARSLFNALPEIGNFITNSFKNSESLIKAVVQVFPQVVQPLSWAISSLGFTLEQIRHLVNVQKKMKQIRKLVKLNAMEYTLEFLHILISDNQSRQITVFEHEKKANNLRLAHGLKLLEENPNLVNFIASSSCYDTEMGKYYLCKNIFINMQERVELKHKLISKSDPDIPDSKKEEYKKLCQVHRQDRHNPSIMRGMLLSGAKKLFGKKSLKFSTYKCEEAFGISKTSPMGRISYYSLDDFDSCQVYGLNNTFNIFSLSRGQQCEIYGGTEGNIFQFNTIFQNCSLFGGGQSGNSIDFSQLEEERNFEILVEEGNTIQLVDADEILSKVETNNLDSIIFGRSNTNDTLVANCLIRNVKIDCHENQSSYHTLRILQMENCDYAMQVKIQGKAQILNEAISGKFVYRTSKIKGNISLELIGSEHVSHLYVASFTNFSSIDDFVINQESTSINIRMIFNLFQVNITIKEAKSFQITFSDSVNFYYNNGQPYVVIFYPKSKGQLWTTYGSALDLFSKRRIDVKVYSERDQESFIFQNGRLQIDHAEMNFSFKPGGLNSKCIDGYNLIILHPKKKSVDNNTAFNPTVINSEKNFTLLVLDLTIITDHMDLWDKKYNMLIEPHISYDTLTLNVIGNRPDRLTTRDHRWHIGNITLMGIMKNDQFKKVKIVARSDFFLSLNSEELIEIKSYPREVCPFSHLVILDQQIVEIDQEFLFNDRMPTKFDLVRVGSSLVVTNLAHKITESLARADPIITLSTVIVKNFFYDPKMQTLKLKFESQGYDLDLKLWKNMPIISYSTWKDKLNFINNNLNENAFLMHYDVRFGNNIEYINLQK